MDRTSWVKEELAKKIVETYLPWRNAQLIGCDVEQIEGKKHNFASQTYSVTLHLKFVEDGAEEHRSHTLFTKLMDEDPVIRKNVLSDEKFYNETIWYSKVIPQFEQLIAESGISNWNCDIYPTCYYASFDSKDGVVALEDLRPKKFNLGDRFCLDVKHAEKAVEAVARSHALAYRWREVDEKSFTEAAQSFKEATIDITMDTLLKICNERALNALEKNPEYSDRVLKFREATSDPFALMKRLLKPDNQLATLCHGDFCRNNILFSESSKHENAMINVKLIDFQTVRYASPAIDLSFFFFMSTTPKFRVAEFDRLFDIYHHTLIKALKDLYQKDEKESIANLDNVFSLQALKDDFAKHAVYGYFIMSFFLPLMLIDDKTRDEMTHLWETNDDKQFEMYPTLGGEFVTAQLVDTLKELLDLGYWPIQDE